MKKILAVFVLLLAFLSFGFIRVKATPPSGTVEITQMFARSVAPSGLMFEATTTVDAFDQECHFVLAKGIHDADYMKNVSGTHGAYLVDRSCGEPDGEGKFRITIINFDGGDPTESDLIARYGTNITAIAYVIPDNETENMVWSEVRTISIADIARKNYNESADPTDFIADIAELTRVKVTHSNSKVDFYKDLDDVTFVAGDTVQLAKGTYSDNITISVNNVTINGVNNGVHYDGDRNTNESIITGDIAIAANTTNLTLDGLKFAGTSKITNAAGSASSHNNDNFTFRNNIVETNLASGKGFIYFQEHGTSGYSYDLLFEYNHFKCINGSSELESLVYIDNNVGLTIRGNKFEDAPNKAFFVEDATKGLAGDLVLSNNIFTNIGTNAFDVDWFSPYPNLSLGKEFLITGNEFSSIGEKAIRFNYCNTTDKYSSIVISDNSFTSVDTGVYFERIFSDMNITVNYNVFNSRPTGSYFSVNTLYDGEKLNAKYNSFKEGGEIVLPNVGKYNASKIDIYSPTAADPDDHIIKAGSTVQLNNDNVNLNMTGTYEYDSCYSDNPSIATISSTGLITGVAVGETDIHVSIVSYNNIEVTIHVEVVNGIVGNVAVFEGSTPSYTYAGSGTKVWSTSNPSVATINSDGQLSALSNGLVDVILEVNSIEVDRLSIVVTPNEFFVDDNWSTYSNDDTITYNEKVYVKGFNVFHTISSSLAASRTIHVLAGSYNEDINVSYEGITILGPYENVVGTGDRTDSNEAIISGTITVAANGFTLQGVKFVGNGKAITWSSAATIQDLSIVNVISTATGKTTSGGRTAVIASDGAATNLVLRGVKLTVEGRAGLNPIAIYKTVNGLTIENCYFDNGAESYTNSEVVRTSTISGAVVIEKNTFIWSTKNYAFLIGNTSNSCTSMTFCNNILRGSESAATTTLGYFNVKSTCSCNIIGNFFDYFDTGTTIYVYGSASGATINIKYNYFGPNVHYKWGSVSGVTQTYENNFYAASQEVATSDVNTYKDKTKADLVNDYKNSALCSTYGGICVYED